MTDDRVFFRDIKPYDVPESLDDLRGPDGGVITLPSGVHRGPGEAAVDLDEDGGTVFAYKLLLEEGMVGDLCRLVHRDRLTRVWGELRLPVRARELWEGRFPELASRS